VENFDKLKDILVDVLGVKAEDVKAESRFVEDLGADSLDLVELIMSFEDKFGVEISDESAEKLITVKDVLDFIEANSKN
jgi:acyl carrier protein